MAAKPLSIAIVGGGPAGLTLARLLLVSPVADRLDLTIFEKDASATARAYQGGTLDLHPETGLAAIKAMDLWDDFQKQARYEGEELVIADKNNVQLVHMQQATDTNLDARPEIDREKLKDMLLTSVLQCEKGNHVVKWGKHLRSVNESTAVLSFADGSTAGPFGLIVGADGAWSRVRPVLTDVRPHFSGVCGIEMHISDPAKEHPDISNMIGRGSYFVFSDGKALMAQRMGDDSLKASYWTMEDEGYSAKLISEHVSNEALKEAILSHLPDWAPELRAIVRASTRFRPWNLYELPVGHRFQHKKGFTLISDAAHLMTPFAGEGVNAGMRDALELSKAIIDSAGSSTDVSNLDAILQEFEEAMFVRGKKVQTQTMNNKVYMFRSDAPVGYLVRMTDEVANMFGKDPTRGFWWVAIQPVKWIAWVYFFSISFWGRWRRWWRESRVRRR